MSQLSGRNTLAQKKGPSVDDLTGGDARAILGRLWKKGGSLREAI